MSDLEVLESLDAMEALLNQVPFPLDPEGIEAWQAAFEAAVASAERGARWPVIQDRAREVHARLMVRLQALEAERDEVRRELTRGAQGTRALKGYAPPR